MLELPHAEGPTGASVNLVLVMIATSFPHAPQATRIGKREEADVVVAVPIFVSL